MLYPQQPLPAPSPLSSALSMACLLALKRHHECLAFVTKEVKHGTTNADVYILRARLYNFFHKVEQEGGMQGARGGPLHLGPKIIGGGQAVSQP